MAQAMYSDRTYNNWTLVLIWCAHLLFLLFFVGLLAVDMMEVAGDVGHEPPSLIAFMTFFVIALIMELLEMVLQSYRLLRPLIYLSFQVYKALLTTIFLIFAVWAYENRGKNEHGIWKYTRIALIALTTCVVLAFYTSLVYAAVVFRRLRKTRTFDFDKERSMNDDNEA